ncbi:MAG: hypothetical protein WBE76_11040 [Terracidiphilus sp.]
MIESKHTLWEIANGAAVVVVSAALAGLAEVAVSKISKSASQQVCKLASRVDSYIVQHERLGEGGRIILWASPRSSSQSLVHERPKKRFDFPLLGGHHNHFSFSGLGRNLRSKYFCRLKAACGCERGCGCYSVFSGFSTAPL